MLFALLYVALISVNVVISAENVTSLSETDEQIRDFVMTVLLLRDVKHAQETGKGVQKATSEEFMHNRASVLKLADQTLKQVDSASAPVKTLFQKIFALETDKNNRDKEREAEIAEVICHTFLLFYYIKVECFNPYAYALIQADRESLRQTY
ncbi:hypothetical protein Y032_0006g2779 [Ancylostoma ceylanicum]|nr:hypothetical protein Y032_0006g2779 [Ancylostoma ceylanicum]